MRWDAWHCNWINNFVDTAITSLLKIRMFFLFETV